jgi:hypothetical protein
VSIRVALNERALHLGRGAAVVARGVSAEMGHVPAVNHPVHSAWLHFKEE